MSDFIREEFNLVILMAGRSERFTRAGYPTPKALLNVENIPILQWILSEFNPSHARVVINESQEKYKPEINQIASTLGISIEISVIKPHQLGPSYSIWLVGEELKSPLPTIVSYCDVGLDPDEAEILLPLLIASPAFLTFQGFHPHLVRNPKFGFVRFLENGEICEIREKQDFGSDENSAASAGIYSFKSGNQLVDLVSEQIHNQEKVNGEFYLSLAYLPLLASGETVKSHKVKTFYSWGTPEDYEDFIYFQKIKGNLSNPSKKGLARVSGITMVLAGGKGSRLKSISNTPKAQLQIAGRMLVEFSLDLAESNPKYLVSTRELNWNLDDSIQIIKLSEDTENALQTCLAGLSSLADSDNALNILASDNIVSLNEKIDLSLPETLHVWTCKDYPFTRLQPDSYSWVKVNDNNTVEALSVKKLPEDNSTWYPIAGNFTFSSAKLAFQLIQAKLLSNSLHDSELHLESIIPVALDLNFRVQIFDVADYYTVGTPIEHQLLEYYLGRA